MLPFPSIKQFRSAKDYAIHKREKTLSYQGRVKLHGCNAGVVLLVNEEKVQYQSRNQILQLGTDNAGFWGEHHKKEMAYLKLFERIKIKCGHEVNENIGIFGEWCGGNIQKSVALNQLPKMYVIFGIQIDGKFEDLNKYKEIHSNENQIYNVLQYKTFDITINMLRPEEKINEIVAIVEEVEKECPVSKSFGISGVGEGVVWVCTEFPGDTEYWFKTKGTEHSVTKTKSLIPKDIEKLDRIQDFVETYVTQARLEQGLDWMNEQRIEFTMRNVKDFIKWVQADIEKEESDTIKECGFLMKDVSSAIGKEAVKFYKSKMLS